MEISQLTNSLTSLLNDKVFLFGCIYLITVIVFFIIQYRQRKKIKTNNRLNELEHKQLMSNQNAINNQLRKLDVRLKSDDEQLKSIKIILIQKILPVLTKDAVVKKLTDEVTELDRKNKESIQEIARLSIQLDDLNTKYQLEKEKTQYSK